MPPRRRNVLARSACTQAHACGSEARSNQASTLSQAVISPRYRSGSRVFSANAKRAGTSVRYSATQRSGTSAPPFSGNKLRSVVSSRSFGPIPFSSRSPTAWTTHQGHARFSMIIHLGLSLLPQRSANDVAWPELVWGLRCTKLYRDGRTEGVVSGYALSEPFEGGSRRAFQYRLFVRGAHLDVTSYSQERPMGQSALADFQKNTRRSPTAGTRFDPWSSKSGRQTHYQ